MYSTYSAFIKPHHALETAAWADKCNDGTSYHIAQLRVDGALGETLYLTLHLEPSTVLRTVDALHELAVKLELTLRDGVNAQ